LLDLETALTQAPDPGAAALLHGTIGNALLRQQRLPEAVACYHKAIDLRPDIPDLYSNLGYALSRQGHLRDAVAALRVAIDLDPANPRAHFNLGEAIGKQGRLPEAADCYRAAIDLRPDIPEAYNSLGFALSQMGRPEEAATILRKAIALRPEYAQAHNNLGFVLAKQQLLDQAASCYRTAIALCPGLSVAWNNLGTVLDELGQLNRAMECYHKAIAAEPEFAEAHANLGMAMLATSNAARGWDEYEWRWQTPEGKRNAPAHQAPRWDGTQAPGRTLLVHAEQGLGDSIQFCRYATLAAAKGLRVVIEAPAPLVRLLRTLDGVAQVVTKGETLPVFDLQIPMLSLPAVLRTTIPAEPGFIRAEPAQAATWRKVLRAMGRTGPRVGVAWAGNPHPGAPDSAAVDRRRSLPLARLAPLLAVPGVHFVSVQKQGPAPSPELGLTDVMHQMADFADTAALIANLDLVISVDTAVAHLAAALGKPVWLLNRFDACWRWGREGADSAWYPSLTQYRQPVAGDWDSVLATVACDLRALVTPAA